MKTALRSRLLADGTIAGLVGTRVDWGLRPQNAGLPAIRMTRAGGARGYTMNGAQATQPYRVQFDCYAATAKAAEELGAAVIACLEPPSGSFLGGFVERDDDSPERNGVEEIHNRSIDIRLFYVSA